jgi:NodT family efflux transporter outer membrane factor (OMF) lipoprotein
MIAESDVGGQAELRGIVGPLAIVKTDLSGAAVTSLIAQFFTFVKHMFGAYNMSMKSFPLGILTALGLVGCTVGPNYHAPKAAVESRFGEVASVSATQPSLPTTRPVQITEWWATFHDPQLDSLINRAVKTNPSLVQAESRIREARAQRVIAGAGEFPTVNVDSGYQHARGSSKVVFPLSAFTGGSATKGKAQPSRVDSPSQAPITSGGAGSSTGAGVPLSPLGLGGLPGVTTDLYQAGFDASWEIDIFGGVRRSVEASSADFEAAVEDRRDVLISLLSEVARNYIDLRGYQRQIDIAQENLHSQQQSLALTEDRFRAGVTTQLDVARARAQVATTAAGIPSLDAQVHDTIHRLSVLLGEPPIGLMAELLTTQPIPLAPAEVPIGMPAELLRRRPDIRRAERQLAAATARVGVATAQLYPRFSITGSFGFDATKFARVASWPARYYAIGPSVTWPIFDAGRIRANIRVQNEAVNQSLSIYEQTVLVAMQDVEDALVDYSREQQRHQALAEAVAANHLAVDLATQQYQQGVVDFLTVLEAQRSLYGAQDSLARSENQISADLVALYKALGGGWEIIAAK